LAVRYRDGASGVIGGEVSSDGRGNDRRTSVANWPTTTTRKYNHLVSIGKRRETQTVIRRRNLKLDIETLIYVFVYVKY